MRRGFTLIELLIASSLLVVIILALYTGFRVGALTHSTSQQVSDDLQGLQLFFDGLERDLRNCIIYDKVSTPANSEFNGSNTDVSFLAHGSKFVPVGNSVIEAGEIQAVSYTYSDKEVLRQGLPFSEFLSKGNAPDSAKAEKMVSGIEEFKISYFDSLPSAANPDPAELDNWEAKSGIPAKVKIALVLARGNRKIEFTRSIILPLNLEIQ